MIRTMRHTLPILFALLLVPGVAGAAPGKARSPGKAQAGGKPLTPGALKSMLRWKGKVEIEKQAPIVLVGGERATLVIAVTYDRPRIEWYQLVLYRPAQKAARAYGAPYTDFEVRDLDGDGVSEVVWGTHFSGGGSQSGGSGICRFEGWNQQDLATFTGEEDNSGWCGEDGGMDLPCESTEVKLEFTDLDGDGKTDVVETVTKTEGEKAPQKTVIRHLYRNGRFERM